VLLGFTANSRRRRAHFMRVLVLGRSACTDVDVRLGLKDVLGSNAAVLAPKGRYVLIACITIFSFILYSSYKLKLKK
jgi:hypothetical protein